MEGAYFVSGIDGVRKRNQQVFCDRSFACVDIKGREAFFRVSEYVVPGWIGPQLLLGDSSNLHMTPLYYLPLALRLRDGLGLLLA